MSEKVTLTAPAIMFIRIDDVEHTFDVYELLAAIVDGQEDHGESGVERLYPLRDAVVSKFGKSADMVAINQMLDLREAVVTLTNRLDEERKKKYSLTASSPVSIQDFPTVSVPGPSEKRMLGLETPPPSNSGE